MTHRLSLFIGSLALCCVLPSCGGGDAFTPTVDPSAATAADGQEGGADGDYLDRQIEVAGWEILVDRYGFGLGDVGFAGGSDGVLQRVTVTSDPELLDTDGDGLDD